MWRNFRPFISIWRNFTSHSVISQIRRNPSRLLQHCTCGEADPWPSSCRPCCGSSSSWCSSTPASLPLSTTGSQSGWTTSRYYLYIYTFSIPLQVLYTVVYCTVHIMYAFRAYQKGGPGTVNMMGTQYSLLFTHVIRSKGFKHYAARPWDIFSRKVGTYSRHTYIYSMVENSVADPFFVCYSWANFWERPDPFLLYLSRLLRMSGSIFVIPEPSFENVRILHKRRRLKRKCIKFYRSL